MLPRDALKDLLHVKGLTRAEQVLLCLAAGGGGPLVVSEIKHLAISAGLRRAKEWNVSNILQRANGLVVRTDTGWELNGSGRNALAKLIATHSLGPAIAPANSLRALLPRVATAQAREFLLEAVVCAEHGQLRAAVVFAWVGAVALLHECVVTKHLLAFNAEALRRDTKWKSATSVDGLAKMKEFDFLQAIESIGVIGKNTRVELEGCLKLRNACGHPSSLSVAGHRVASHIEVLLLNVFAPFAT
jgi:hypothetical protein